MTGSATRAEQETLRRYYFNQVFTIVVMTGSATRAEQKTLRRYSFNQEGDRVAYREGTFTRSEKADRATSISCILSDKGWHGSVQGSQFARALHGEHPAIQLHPAAGNPTAGMAQASVRSVCCRFEIVSHCARHLKHRSFGSSIYRLDSSRAAPAVGKS
jgi:hypothetical protein